MNVHCSSTFFQDKEHGLASFWQSGQILLLFFPKCTGWHLWGECWNMHWVHCPYPQPLQMLGSKQVSSWTIWVTCIILYRLPVRDHFHSWLDDGGVSCFSQTCPCLGLGGQGLQFALQPSDGEFKGTPWACRPHVQRAGVSAVMSVMFKRASASINCFCREALAVSCL